MRVLQGARAPEGEVVPVAERWILAALFAATLLLRVIYIFHYRIDTDEPQHLHSSWGWTRGLVEYRDVFDNHVPLFHLLMAPVLAAFGERPDILIMMRLVMLSTYAASLVGTFLLGRALYGARAGLWAAALLSSQSIFFFRSVEYRTDDLWVTLLVFTLFALLGGAPTRKRFFVGGLILGTSLSVTLKTLMMILSLGGAGILLPLVSTEARRAISPRRAAELVGSFLGGLAIVPALVGLFIVSVGAWDQFVYCVQKHNMVATDHRHSRVSMRHVGLAALILPMAWWGSRISRLRGASALGPQAAALLLVVGVYNCLLKLVWPVVETQTMLSFYPLMALGVASIPFGFRSPEPRPSAGRVPAWFPSTPLLAGMIALQVARLPALVPLWKDDARLATEQIDAVLKLTDRDDYVLDPNGEAVFRKRPYYLLLEKFTCERLQRGLLSDDLPKACLDTRTCVIIDEGDKYVPTSRRFLDAAYIKVGRVSVAGRILRRERFQAGDEVRFTSIIPAEYDLVTESGRISGTLDGTPFTAARRLDSGPHVFIPDRGSERLALLWSRALERGFTPFKVEGK